MTDRPKLYPSHPHQWTDAPRGGYPSGSTPADQIAVPADALRPSPSTLARCTVCGFEVPWRLAKVDGIDTDSRCTHQGATGQCLDHQGHLGDHQWPQPDQPEQETA